jgi:hypothetical protein
MVVTVGLLDWRIFSDPRLGEELSTGLLGQGGLTKLKQLSAGSAKVPTTSIVGVLLLSMDLQQVVDLLKNESEEVQVLDAPGSCWVLSFND